MTDGIETVINSRKGDGSVRRTWSCVLMDRDDTELLFLGVFDNDVRHADLGHITKGTVSYEYYWLDRWYNIFVFFEPDGRFRNYYCNICMPPTFETGVLDYIDLDIDIVVWPDWTYRVLDEDEYVRNAALYRYSETTRRKTKEAVAELLSLIEARSLPVRH